MSEFANPAPVETDAQPVGFSEGDWCDCCGKTVGVGALVRVHDDDPASAYLNYLCRRCAEEFTQNRSRL